MTLNKAKVESGVLLAERWIIAALRHRKFFSIEELNQAIRELRERINQRPFRKREGSRVSQFVALDKHALNPLPAEPFDLSQWSRARVNIDYHIVFDTNYYSVPYNLVHELVEVRSTPTTVEIFLKRLARIDVLVIDDWAMAPLLEPERRDFWEICEDRYQVRSTILTSQLPVSRWREQIGDPTLADGILDRGLQLFHQLEPVHLGHLNVQNGEVQLERLGQPNGLAG